MNQQEELRLCECSCGQQVTRSGNRYIYNHHHRGKPLTEEHKRRDSEALKGRKVTWGNKIGLSLTGKPKSESHKQNLRCPKSEDHRRKIGDTTRGVSRGPFSETHRFNMSLAQLGIPKSDEHVRNMLAALRKRPTSLESSIITLLTDLDIKFEYTGDGKLVIGGKCPDFSLGNARLLEGFGNYWHRPEEEQPRIEHFQKFGYNTLIVWENELREKELLSRKILQFTGAL